jgi:hypothetical protein
LNEQIIPFVKHVKYLGVICDKRITWRPHIEMLETKAFRTFIRFYSLFKSERLSTNIKLTLYKALIRSVLTYACPAWELAADTYLLKLQRLQNKVLRPIGNFPKVHTGPRFAHSFQRSVCISLHNKIVHATSRSHANHENEHVRGIGHGEARHRKYKEA